jgi:hypothetical protein
MRAVLYGLVLSAATANLAAADRMVDYVSPSLFEDPSTTLNRVVFLSATNFQTVATCLQPDSDADRWERFEMEFGVKQPNDSAALNSLRAAKYQLDKATFTIQEWLNNIEDALRFDYGWNDLGAPAPKPYRTTSSPGPVDALLSARLKSDINLKLTGGSFVGVKLVLPLGN